MKPRFELWDSGSANFLGAYDSVGDVLDKLKRAFPTAESRRHIADLVLTLELGGEDDDAMILLSGNDLYRLVRPISASEVIVR